MGLIDHLKNKVKALVLWGVAGLLFLFAIASAADKNISFLCLPFGIMAILAVLAAEYYRDKPTPY